jgi:c-di-GMP-binding flagellar brake protein YcgR
MYGTEATARRHSRIDTRLDISLRLIDKQVRAETKDLSLGGMFLISDLPVSLGDELEFELLLPAGMPAVKGKAQVVHFRQPAQEGVLPGFGLRFLSVDVGLLQQYLIKLVRGEIKPIVDEKRRHGRIKRPLHASLAAPGQTDSVKVRDISRSGALLETEVLAAEGSLAEMNFVHPLTLQRLRLTGRVVRMVDSGPDDQHHVRGAGVAFDELKEDQLDRLLTFLTDIITLEAS